MQPIYDGIDYRYSSSDPDRSKAVEIISNIVGTRPDLDGLDYSLALYAGGSGVDDRLAIRFKDNPLNWSAISKRLRLKNPTQAIASPDWREAFEWLICGDNSPTDITGDASSFIERHRHSFQDSPDSSTELAFSDESDVNSWCVIWRTNGWVNYLSFDQG
ncbi:hypothetical protein [Thermomonas sp.]|uniref:hypothetical protein n=1 Tax=Thermomonas sp. TaxID=1971895 RepID=UPI0035AF6CCC